MPASRADLSRWYDDAPPGATHMVVRCDDFEYRGDPRDTCCYPVYVMPGEDVREVADREGDRTMEVYSYRLTKDEQISASRRVFNYE